MNLNAIGDAGCQQLRKLATLKDLELRSNTILDLGGYHLAFLTNLTRLDLSTTVHKQAKTRLDRGGLATSAS